MECTDRAVLEDVPEALNGVRVDRAMHVLADAVTHGAMRELLTQFRVAAMVVGRDQANLCGHCHADEGTESCNAGVFESRER